MESKQRGLLRYGLLGPTKNTADQVKYATSAYRFLWWGAMNEEAQKALARLLVNVAVMIGAIVWAIIKIRNRAKK